MKTITAYSYKGGTGRTLAVANIARYFANFGQRVFTIDLDLEAPGLHYKLHLGSPELRPVVSHGVVDFMHDCLFGGQHPTSLAGYTQELQGVDKYGGKIFLMPAGDVTASRYWQRLAKFNWYELFYGDDSRGVPFFLELKERIREEFNPDFLIIDSRTGITETGGVALTLLPDFVICLMLDNEENLVGAREVLRSTIGAVRLEGQEPIKTIPVLARIPEQIDNAWEKQTLDRVKAFLNEECQVKERTLSISELYVLHSESELQKKESLRVGGEKTVDQSPLLRDYLRLFATLIEQNVILSRVDQLTQEATRRALDDPESVEKDIEALSVTLPHPETYRALLRFYRLRGKDRQTMLNTAYQLWRLSEQDSDPILWEIVRSYFASERVHIARQNIPLNFIEAVWRANGSSDPSIGLHLADAYFHFQDNKAKAQEIITSLIDSTTHLEQIVPQCLARLVQYRALDDANAIIAAFADVLGENPMFVTGWARLILANDDVEAAKTFVNSVPERLQQLMTANIVDYARVLVLAGRQADCIGTLRTLLNDALTSEAARGELVELGLAFNEVGQEAQFKKQIQRALPQPTAAQIIEDVKNRGSVQNPRRRLGSPRLF